MTLEGGLIPLTSETFRKCEIGYVLVDCDGIPWIIIKVVNDARGVPSSFHLERQHDSHRMIVAIVPGEEVGFTECEWVITDNSDPNLSKDALSKKFMDVEKLSIKGTIHTSEYWKSRCK